MSRHQLVFEAFANQPFSFRNGFMPREWQLECLDAYRSSTDGWVFSGTPHVFSICAGTGAGKTKMAGLLTALLLNNKHMEQVVVVVPNRSILKKTLRDFRQFFGIHLEVFHKKKHGQGVPRLISGYILTYGALINNPVLHAQLCSSTPTLVIFDEVHHLSENDEWGKAARYAFEKAYRVLAMTGTPYRPANDPRIWPLAYEDTVVNGLVNLLIDYPYPLGRAVADCVCRMPLFQFSSGTIQIRLTPDSAPISSSFTDAGANQTIARLRLRGAVQFGSICRKTLLRETLTRCRAEGRKVAIFLGGDSVGDLPPTEDANCFLPQELEELGYGKDQYETVTGDDVEALRKIEAFGAHPTKWILISVNMISEGTDIPEISAAIFLTSVTAKQTTIQRIGRALRLMGETDAHKDALIFMFEDPELVELAREINTGIKQEIELKRLKRERSDTGNSEQERRARAEAIGVAGGEASMVMFHGMSWPTDSFQQAFAELKQEGLPLTLLNAVLQLREKRKGSHDCR